VGRKWIVPVVATAALVTAGLVVPPALAGEPDARGRELVAQLRERLPDDLRERRAAAGLSDPPAALSVIDPDQYECSEDTPFRNWLTGQLAPMTPEQVEGARTILEFDVATLDAVFFPQPERQRFFGADGEHTNRLRRTFRNLQGFWDVPSRDIELVPIHGDVVLDTARSARALQAGLGLTPEQAATTAAELKELADQDVYQHGELPLFTANAFAVSFAPDEELPPGVSTSRKIAVGNGILTGVEAIGFGDIGPDNVLAHEFGHQVQDSNGLFENEVPSPESTRRIELMADSLGAYYLGHARGGDASWRRLRQSAELATTIGDCRFDSEGHHGTPNQRGRAAEWGAKLSQAGRRILPSARVIALFDRKLPAIVAPDAPDDITITSAERTEAAS